VAGHSATPFSVLRERAGLSLQDVVSLFGLSMERAGMLEQGLAKAEARHLQALHGLAVAGRAGEMAAAIPHRSQAANADRPLGDASPLALATSAKRRALPRRNGEADAMAPIATTPQLVSIALALAGAEKALSPAERALAARVAPCRNARLLTAVRKAILTGRDPLGDAFARINPPEVRRPLGATYTPEKISAAMIEWAAEQAEPARVVDPGAGSGRFLIASAQRFPKAQLVGIEIDPVAAIMLRANLAVLGLSGRARVLVEDYRSAPLPPIRGRTLFIGNPPYVRHHDIDERSKAWFALAAGLQGVRASKLAGLHVHFYVRTLALARDRDFGTFITSAEWLDVNYGSALRQLLAGRLGGTALHVLDAKAMPFADAAATGAIACFQSAAAPHTFACDR
jgi:hypothetical protein